jgi:pyruvate dehydrogenase E2 component (dihydrolipoamide acetyltransferase)
MSRPFVLPDLGEGLTEAEIVKVLVNEGDVLVEDAPLLEVETDKATVEIPSPFAGRVARIHVHPGQSVKVGDVLVTFDDAGAAGAAMPAAAATRSAAAASASTTASRPAADSASAAGGRVASGRAAGDGGHAAVTTLPPAIGPVPATPATRRLARELGVDLRAVRGTGPGGRVTDENVKAAAGGASGSRAAVAADGRGANRGAMATDTRSAERAAVAKPLAAVGVEPPALPRFEQWGPVERQPLSHLRRTIAERMTLSATLIPHVTHFDRADVTELDAIIRRNVEPARERGLTLTLTSFLLKAAALALQEHPQFNASLDPAAGELIVKRYCHLGVAVAAERGLIVPVIRDVDKKPLVEVQRELAALAQRVREGKATLEDLRGGTFTITNIGALGGTGAIPIINYPEVAILGVARGREEPVVHEGKIVPRMLLPISLTFDHRVADGADGARFAAAIVRRLERPEQLLLEW